MRHVGQSGQPKSRNSGARQRRNRRKRNWFRIILCLMLLALTGELVFLALTSPRLRIVRIDVRGAEMVPVSVVREHAKFVIGKNLILANTSRVKKNVLREPALKTVTVYRFPMNKLIIRVRERIPYAALAANGNFYLMDEGGLVYRQTKEILSNWLTFELTGSLPVRVGAKLNPVLLEVITDCLAKSEKSGFRAIKISVDPANDMCLNMESGLYVKLGPAIDLEEKFEVLKEIIARKPEITSEAEYIDLRCPTAPAWKAKN